MRISRSSANWLTVRAFDFELKRILLAGPVIVSKPPPKAIRPGKFGKDLDVELEHGRFRPGRDGEGVPVSVNVAEAKKGILARKKLEQGRTL